MSLFGKHIFRSIKKTPLQPILIVLALIASAITVISAVQISLGIIKYNDERLNQDNYISDISIEASARSEVRMFFVRDAEKIIGNDGAVLGEFKLTGVTDYESSGELTAISAVDLLMADDFYRFRFKEYGEITEKDINNTIIISTYTAEKYNLSLGDSFSIKLLGKIFDFRIGAIALPDGILAESAGIISIGAVSAALASANESFGALADSLIPYTSLRIAIYDIAQIDDYISKLRADKSFADAIIIKESENTENLEFLNFVSVSIAFLCTIIVLALSGIVIVAALNLLNKKRQRDMALFMICGADNKALRRLLLIECAIYGIIASINGVLLSLITSSAINSLFGWKNDSLIYRNSVVTGIIVTMGIVILTVYAHSKKYAKVSSAQLLSNEDICEKFVYSKRAIAITTALFAISLMAALILPIKYRFIIGCIVLGAAVALIFTVTPFIVSLLRYAVNVLEGLRRVPIKLTLALKRIITSRQMVHTARLITILITLIITLGTCLTSVIQQTNLIDNILSSDYLAIGADERCDDALNDIDSIENAFRVAIMRNMSTEFGTGILALSLSDEASRHIDSDVVPKALPRGNQAAISRGLSILTGSSVGEEVCFINATNKCSFIVSEIIDVPSNILFIDAEHVGQSNDLLCVVVKDGVSADEIAKISSTLEVRGAMLVKSDAFLQEITGLIVVYSEIIKYILIIAVITSCIGVFNALMSIRYVKITERKVYYSLGFTRRSIASIEALEILITVVISAVIAGIFGLGILKIIDISVNAFGLDLL